MGEGGGSPEQRPVTEQSRFREALSRQRERIGRFLRPRNIGLASAGVAAVVGASVALAEQGGSSQPAGKDATGPVVEGHNPHTKTLEDELKALGLPLAKNRLVIDPAQRRKLADNAAIVLSDSPFKKLRLPGGGTVQDLIDSGLSKAQTISVLQHANPASNQVETDINPGKPDGKQQVNSPISILTSYDLYGAENTGTVSGGVYSVVSITVDSNGALKYEVPSSDKPVFTQTGAEAFGKKLAPDLPVQPIVPGSGEVDFGNPNGKGSSMQFFTDGQVIWAGHSGFAFDAASLLKQGDSNSPSIRDVELAYAILSSPHNINLDALPSDSRQKLAPFVRYRNGGMTDGTVPVPSAGAPARPPSWTFADPAFAELYKAALN